MQKRIAFITLKQYEMQHKSFLENERADLMASEIVLGDSEYQSSAKTIFESILLDHIKNSGAVIIDRNNEDDTSADTQKVFQARTPISAGELLKKTLSQGGYKEKNLENTTLLEQFHLSNLVIFLANLLLG